MCLVIILLILRFPYPKRFELHRGERVYGWLLDFDLPRLPPILLFVRDVVLIGLDVGVGHHASAIANDAVFERVLALHLEVSQAALRCLDFTIKLVVLVVHYCQIHIRKYILPLLTPLLLLLPILILPLLILGLGQVFTMAVRSWTEIHLHRPFIDVGLHFAFLRALYDWLWRRLWL